MTLDLTLDQPAETPIAAEREAATANVATIATIVTIDSVVVRLAERPDGSLAFLPNGNRAPLVIDRFQRQAMMAALSEG